MHNANQIIDAYRQADFETKLNLFLSHRSLRDQFSQIDERDRQTTISAPAKKANFFQRQPVHHLIRRM
jgi:hypothetical protein